MNEFPTLLNVTELAKSLPYSRTFIQAVKHAGFQFTHGRRTLVQPFLDWLAAHPDFRSTDYCTKGAKR